MLFIYSNLYLLKLLLIPFKKIYYILIKKIYIDIYVGSIFKITLNK
ncbi:hypothetical protein CLD_2379 [Clostridium botulinum B1 str. Okra]|uniref:Uncharacterized protein n=1 Tax=Clostridium botulinum (strain Okra / Type B1) TaxID=498213 RepID=B1IGU7_CLOBK|nr:hypothetical protein CLD_2379 [Clostridium botulinum B1 str. Okra]